MSDYFPPELIAQIRSANDIIEVISEFVPLKKRGRNYFGRCPFHAEKTPSFSVNPEKQVFHCFGCGQGGNVVTFLMNHEKLGFVESVKLLAKRANIRLPHKQVSKEELKLIDKLHFVNQLAASYFSGQLRQVSGGEARSYLKKRGISAETIELFRLGFAPDEWDGLMKFAANKGGDLPTLFSAGLIVEKSDGKGYYDRFRKRLTFPIFNSSGGVVAFAGRILNPDDSPKYMNSPESPIYQKGKLLYGLNFSKEVIRETRTAIVVEGYMDFLALYQAGLKNLVASCGTAFTSDQARLLSRYAELVILLFDSDSAGQSAVLRSVDLLYDAGVEVKVALLPAGHDPDSYVNNFGLPKLQEVMGASVSYVKFKANRLRDKFVNLPLKEQEEILADFAQTAFKISDRVRRGLFLRQVQEQLGVSESLLRAALQKVGRKDKSEVEPKTSVKNKPDQTSWEKEFLGILMDNPEWIEKAGGETKEEDFSTPEHQEVWKLITEEYRSTGKFDLAECLESVENKTMSQLLLEIANLESRPSDIMNTFGDYLSRFRARRKETELSRLKQLLRQAEEEKDLEKSLVLERKLKEALENSGKERGATR